MTHRISTSERARRRQAISDLVHRQVEEVIHSRTRQHTSEVCLASEHDECFYADCLCRCHDGEESHPGLTHRCQHCGVGVQWSVGTMDPTGHWSHITGPHNHPAKAVRRKTSAAP